MDGDIRPLGRWAMSLTRVPALKRWIHGLAANALAKTCIEPNAVVVDLLPPRKARDAGGGGREAEEAEEGAPPAACPGAPVGLLTVGVLEACGLLPGGAYAVAASHWRDEEKTATACGEGPRWDARFHFPIRHWDAGGVLRIALLDASDGGELGEAFSLRVLSLAGAGTREAVLGGQDAPRRGWTLRVTLRLDVFEEPQGPPPHVSPYARQPFAAGRPDPRDAAPPPGRRVAAVLLMSVAELGVRDAHTEAGGGSSLLRGARALSLLGNVRPLMLVDNLLSGSSSGVWVRAELGNNHRETRLARRLVGPSPLSKTYAIHDRLMFVIPDWGGGDEGEAPGGGIAGRMPVLLRVSAHVKRVGEPARTWGDCILGLARFLDGHPCELVLKMSSHGTAPLWRAGARGAAPPPERFLRLTMRIELDKDLLPPRARIEAAQADSLSRSLLSDLGATRRVVSAQRPACCLKLRLIAVRGLARRGHLFLGLWDLSTAAVRLSIASASGVERCSFYSRTSSRPDAAGMMGFGGRDGGAPPEWYPVLHSPWAAAAILRIQVFSRSRSAAHGVRALAQRTLSIASELPDCVPVEAWFEMGPGREGIGRAATTDAAGNFGLTPRGPEVLLRVHTTWFGDGADRERPTGLASLWRSAEPTMLPPRTLDPLAPTGAAWNGLLPRVLGRWQLPLPPTARRLMGITLALVAVEARGLVGEAWGLGRPRVRVAALYGGPGPRPVRSRGVVPSWHSEGVERSSALASGAFYREPRLAFWSLPPIVQKQAGRAGRLLHLPASARPRDETVYHVTWNHRFEFHLDPDVPTALEVRVTEHGLLTPKVLGYFVLDLAETLDAWFRPGEPPLDVWVPLSGGGLGAEVHLLLAGDRARRARVA